MWFCPESQGVCYLMLNIVKITILLLVALNIYSLLIVIHRIVWYCLNFSLQMKFWIIYSLISLIKFTLMILITIINQKLPQILKHSPQL